MDVDYPLEGQIANLAFLEKLYQEYQAHPRELDSSWSRFFQKMGVEEGFAPEPILSKTSQAEQISHLIEAFRQHGHLLAIINPLSLEKRKEPKQLSLQELGFQQSQNKDLFPTLGILPEKQASLQDIVGALKRHYCQTTGYQFKEFTDPEIEIWIQQSIESAQFDQPLSREEKLIILDVLTRAEVLETFLHTKHVGKKRFSLEGGETLIAMLTMLVAKGSVQGIEQLFIGMSHRGRLNVLANILNKPIESILKDFDDEYKPSPFEGMGDIRYHKGYVNESVKTFRGTSIKMTVAPNPSHLESINPVIQGQVHAKQMLVGDEKERKKIVPIVMHGDAALSGQGIVYEILQMSKLHGFETGGTLHFVINNQIGFTTDPQEGRSTLYCTDIARTFGAPVFHVNAEDPESCVRASLLALDVRQKFHCDVFIDLNCYRKYGHNEGDEPAFTQPVEYQIIRKKQSIRSLYLEQLLKEGVIDEEVAEARENKLKEYLQKAYDQSQEQSSKTEETKVEEQKNQTTHQVDTRVDANLLREIAQRLSKIPEGFHLHPKLEHLIKERNRAIQEDKPFDWGMAELLGYATLLWEGIPVRLVGQDSGRGTFSHRHALWVDQANNQPYYPLAHLKENQGKFEVLNTCLSEAAALGFEYGYSTICTKCLTIWEAQFGDFANSAQVIIDQYIASGEEKWGQTSNLVLFLPHGFEGQGPEHSSARFERFLSLAGHDNMQIVNPTTPAQLFHLLRRQIKQTWRKPLVVLTPKGLLRHPACTSRVADLAEGEFQPIIDDLRKPKNAKRLVLCSGRIYYDLDAQREKEKKQDIAIIRLEQLYPLNTKVLKSLINQYKQINECLWVQEEPENMGAWPYISLILSKLLPNNIPLIYVGRERSATPATGFYARHKQELANILQRVFQA